MKNQDYQNILCDYFKTGLNLEIQSNDNTSSPSSSFYTSKPLYHPSCLLDMNWNDGDDDVFMLNMFKKVFGAPRIQSQDDYHPSSSTPKSDYKSLGDSFSEYRFLDVAAPFAKNMVTECVRVPSSKHVAQILGKKGCKIRALRETTNTYIRSPLPKEEPVFTVKGEKENVSEAVNSIKSASDFFTSLENEKELSHNMAIKSSQGEAIVVKFSIPENFVGLVVGVKGGTIKEIEKQTKTYIQSPTMDSDSIFTITGSPEHCEKAMNFISRYLALRGIASGTVECLYDMNMSLGSGAASNPGCNYFFAWVFNDKAE